MDQTFKLLYFHIYPTQFTTTLLHETTSFKPVFYFLNNEHATNCNVEIYAIVKDKEELIWRITKYGNTSYVIRYFNGKLFARYTLKNHKITGYVYIYSNEYLKYILNYDNNNLHGKQFLVEGGTTILANHGKVSNRNVFDIHKIACDLLKWI